MERYNWNKFPDVLEVHEDLTDFIESDCLHGVIIVMVYDYNKPETPSRTEYVTSLPELYYIIRVSEYNAIKILKKQNFGHYVLIVEKKCSIREKVQKLKAEGKL